MDANISLEPKSATRHPFRWRYMGLACFWACSMLTFRSSILLTGQANSPEYNTLVVVVSFLANMTVLLLVSALVERAPANLAKLPSWLFCASIVTGLVLVHGAGRFFTDVPMLVVLLTGAVLAGIGYGYFWGSWADVLGRVHPSHTAIYAPAAFLCTTVLFLVVSLAASWGPLPALALMVPLPIVSLGCLHRCQHDEKETEATRPLPRQYLQALTTLMPLIIATLVFSCLFGFMWETTVLSSPSASQAHELPMLLTLGAAMLLMGFVLVSQRRINLALAYQILIPITIVLFALIPFFWQGYPVVLNAVMSTVYGVFDVIIWYLVVSTAYDFAVSGFVVGGIVRALAILMRLVGIGIGHLVMLIPNMTDGAVVGVCIGAVYLLVILLWFLWHSSKRKPLYASDDADLFTMPPASARETTMPANGGESPLPGDEQGASREKDDGASRDEEAICAAIAEDYGLTRREAEVLPYLAKGRSAKVIAEALFVSESTIRTHTRRILEKTCLHSKQDVIDLVDRY